MTLTAKYLRQVLTYNPATGEFVWNQSRGRVAAGHIAGCARPDGYTLIRIDGSPYLAHRLAYLWMTGKPASSQIDHKNLDRQDNRWCNLRCATHAENVANSPKRKNNTTGYKGVVLHKPGVYRARIKLGGVTTHLGLFKSAKKAAEAYNAFARKHYKSYTHASLKKL